MRVSWPRAAVGGVEGRRWRQALVRQREASGVARLCVIDVGSALVAVAAWRLLASATSHIEAIEQAGKRPSHASLLVAAAVLQ